MKPIVGHPKLSLTGNIYGEIDNDSYTKAWTRVY